MRVVDFTGFTVLDVVSVGLLAVLAASQRYIVTFVESEPLQIPSTEKFFVIAPSADTAIMGLVMTTGPIMLLLESVELPGGE